MIAILMIRLIITIVAGTWGQQNAHYYVLYWLPDK